MQAACLRAEDATHTHESLLKRPKRRPVDISVVPHRVKRQTERVSGSCSRMQHQNRKHTR